MLTIRRAQLDDMQQHLRSVFEDRMLLHIQQCFFDQYESLGETAVKALIDSGIEQAQSLGFQSERDICLFLDLVMVFGPDFHHGKYPWATEALSDPMQTDPAKKMDALFMGALKYFEHNPDTPTWHDSFEPPGRAI